MFDLIPIWKRLRRSSKRRATVGKPPRPRLALEALDDRIMPSITSTFSAATGVLTVAGDELDNTIVVSRDAAGTILVNNGAVVIQGGQATIANTSRILVTGGAGNDALTLDETNGGLPQASLDGGAGNDVLTGGAVAHDPGIFDTLLGAMPTENSVITPAGVIRPIRSGNCSVNQRLPSGPAVISAGWPPGVMPAENSVITPAGVIRPIRPARDSVNQRLPSGPRVIPKGLLLAAGIGNSVTDSRMRSSSASSASLRRGGFRTVIPLRRPLSRSRFAMKLRTDI